MKHIKNSIKGSIYLLEHAGIPIALSTDFSEPIKNGTLCVDTTNQDLYILKNNTWVIMGAGFNVDDWIPRKGTDVNKPVYGDIEIVDGIKLYSGQSGVNFSDAQLGFEYSDNDLNTLINNNLTLNRNVIFQRSDVITSLDSSSKNNFINKITNTTAPGVIFSNSSDNIINSKIPFPTTFTNFNSNTLSGNIGNIADFSSTTNSSFYINTIPALNFSNNLNNHIILSIEQTQLFTMLSNSNLNLRARIYGNNSIIQYNSYNYVEGTMKNTTLFNNNYVNFQGHTSDTILSYNNYIYNLGHITGNETGNLTGSASTTSIITASYQVYNGGALGFINFNNINNFTLLGKNTSIIAQTSNDNLLINNNGYSIKGSSNKNIMINNENINFSSSRKYSKMETSTYNILFNNNQIYSTSANYNLIVNTDKIELYGSNNLVFTPKETTGGFTGKIYGRNNVIFSLKQNKNYAIDSNVFTFGDINSTSGIHIKNGNILIGNIDIDSTLSKNNQLFGAKRLQNINHAGQNNNMFLNVDNFIVPDSNTVYLPSKFYGINLGYFGLFNLNNISSDRYWNFPDKSGDIALLSDIVASTSGGGSVLADNGLTLTSNTVELGGILTKNTTVTDNGGGHNFTLKSKNISIGSDSGPDILSMSSGNVNIYSLINTNINAASSLNINTNNIVIKGGDLNLTTPRYQLSDSKFASSASAVELTAINLGFNINSGNGFNLNIGGTSNFKLLGQTNFYSQSRLNIVSDNKINLTAAAQIYGTAGGGVIFETPAQFLVTADSPIKLTSNQAPIYLTAPQAPIFLSAANAPIYINTSIALAYQNTNANSYIYTNQDLTIPHIKWVKDYVASSSTSGNYLSLTGGTMSGSISMGNSTGAKLTGSSLGTFVNFFNEIDLAPPTGGGGFSGSPMIIKTTTNSNPNTFSQIKMDSSVTLSSSTTSSIANQSYLTINSNNISLQTGTLTAAFLDTSLLLSHNQTFKFPAKSGIFALTSDSSTSGNGLTSVGNKINLGGNIVQNTNLDFQNNYNFGLNNLDNFYLSGSNFYANSNIKINASKPTISNGALTSISTNDIDPDLGGFNFGVRTHSTSGASHFFNYLTMSDYYGSVLSHSRNSDSSIISINVDNLSAQISSGANTSSVNMSPSNMNIASPSIQIQGNGVMQDGNFSTSIDWGNRNLFDNNSNVSLDWKGRTLNDESGNSLFYWSSAGILLQSSYNIALNAIEGVAINTNGNAAVLKSDNLTASPRTYQFPDLDGELLAVSATTTETVVSDTTLTITIGGVTYKILAVTV